MPRFVYSNNLASSYDVDYNIFVNSGAGDWSYDPFAENASNQPSLSMLPRIRERSERARLSLDGARSSRQLDSRGNSSALRSNLYEQTQDSEGRGTSHRTRDWAPHDRYLQPSPQAPHASLPQFQPGYLPVLAANPEAALAEPTFCISPEHGERMQVAFRQVRRKLLHTFYRSIDQQIVGQLGRSDSFAPKGEADLSAADSDIHSGPFQRWYRERRTIDLDAFFEARVPHRGAKTRPIVCDDLLQGLKRRIEAEHRIDHPGVSPNLSSGRIELPRLTVEGLPLHILKARGTRNQVDSSWLTEKRVETPWFHQVTEKAFWDQRQQDDAAHQAPYFEPEVVFEAYGDAETRDAFPPWLFAGNVGLFFAEFQELSLQVRLELSRATGIFDAFDVYDLFSFLPENPLQRTFQYLGRKPSLQWDPQVRALKAQPPEVGQEQEDAAESATLSPALNLYRARHTSLFRHFARSTQRIFSLADCVAFLAAGSAVFGDPPGQSEESVLSRKRLERNTVADALRRYLDRSWAEKSSTWQYVESEND